MMVLRIKDLKPGMVVAKRVTDRNGRLILSAGEEISKKQIRTFKAWGITEVEVESSEEVLVEVASEDATREVPESIMKEVDELFRYTDRRHPVIAELIELCILRKMQ